MLYMFAFLVTKCIYLPLLRFIMYATMANSYFACASIIRHRRLERGMKRRQFNWLVLISHFKRKLVYRVAAALFRLINSSAGRQWRQVGQLWLSGWGYLAAGKGRVKIRIHELKINEPKKSSTDLSSRHFLLVFDGVPHFHYALEPCPLPIEMTFGCEKSIREG